MHIHLKELLEDPVFAGCKILAGAKGLNREVSRISVFDCPYHAGLVANGIVAPGDIFISCLEQFHPGDHTVQLFLNSLVEMETSGLLIVPTGTREVLTPSLLSFCEQHDYPVILLRSESSYAEIMTAVNRYLALNTRNSLNQQKMYRLRYEAVSEKEMMEVLHSMNPRFQESIAVIFADGQAFSELTLRDLTQYFERQGEDLLISGNPHIILLSDSDKIRLEKHVHVAAGMLKKCLQDCRLGFSRIGSQRKIRRLLNEAELALEAAALLHQDENSYFPLSPFYLILSARDSAEEIDFYKAYKEAVRQFVSADALAEYLNTVQAFVENAGSYKLTASQIKQHENTVRYRIHRVKEALHMEENTIQFYETIALAVKIQKIRKQEK